MCIFHSINRKKKKQNSLFFKIINFTYVCENKRISNFNLYSYFEKSNVYKTTSKQILTNTSAL